jgi:hypothetical protein
MGKSPSKNKSPPKTKGLYITILYNGI